MTKGQLSALLIALGVCVAIGVSVQGLGAEPSASSGPPRPGRAAGEAIYAQRCASCHDHPEGRIPSKQVISGHEDQFRPPSLNGGCRLGKATFARCLGNDELAPIPAYRGIAIELREAISLA